MEQPGRPEVIPLFPDNPGFHDEWPRKLKDIFPSPFEGAKVVLNKMLSSRFQLVHTVNLADSAASAGVPGVPPYTFQATCVGKAEHEELTPVMMAEIDNSGSLNGQVIGYLNQRLRYKGVVQTQKSKWLMSQGALEYRGNSYSSSVIAFNPDILAGTGVLSTNFLKRISPSLSLGSEFTIHNTQGQIKTNLGVMGKYSGGKWECHGSANNSGFQAGYMHECSKTTSVGVEWDCSAVQGESNVTFGYKIDLTEVGNFCVKGSIDTTGTVSAVYEKRIHPFTLALSASLNHYRGLSRFGFGLTIG